MNKIKSLNESIINDLYVENLEEKLDMSRISAINLIIDSSNFFSVMGDDDCVDCGGQCSGLCGALCEGKCMGECQEFCGWKRNPYNIESEVSNPNPWANIWNTMAVSEQISSR